MTGSTTALAAAKRHRLSAVATPGAAAGLGPRFASSMRRMVSLRAAAASAPRSARAFRRATIRPAGRDRPQGRGPTRGPPSPGRVAAAAPAARREPRRSSAMRRARRASAELQAASGKLQGCRGFPLGGGLSVGPRGGGGLFRGLGGQLGCSRSPATRSPVTATGARPGAARSPGPPMTW